MGPEPAILEIAALVLGCSVAIFIALLGIAIYAEGKLEERKND